MQMKVNAALTIIGTLVAAALTGTPVARADIPVHGKPNVAPWSELVKTPPTGTNRHCVCGWLYHGTSIMWTDFTNHDPNDDIDGRSNTTCLQTCETSTKSGLIPAVRSPTKLAMCAAYTFGSDGKWGSAEVTTDTACRYFFTRTDAFTPVSIAQWESGYRTAPETVVKKLHFFHWGRQSTDPAGNLTSGAPSQSNVDQIVKDPNDWADRLASVKSEWKVYYWFATETGGALPGKLSKNVTAQPIGSGTSGFKDVGTLLDGTPWSGKKALIENVIGTLVHYGLWANVKDIVGYLILYREGGYLFDNTTMSYLSGGRATELSLTRGARGGLKCPIYVTKPRALLAEERFPMDEGIGQTFYEMNLLYHPRASVTTAGILDCIVGEIGEAGLNTGGAVAGHPIVTKGNPGYDGYLSWHAGVKRENGERITACVEAYMHVCQRDNFVEPSLSAWISRDPVELEHTVAETLTNRLNTFLVVQDPLYVWKFYSALKKR